MTTTENRKVTYKLTAEDVDQYNFEKQESEPLAIEGQSVPFIITRRSLDRIVDGYAIIGTKVAEVFQYEYILPGNGNGQYYQSQSQPESA